MLCLGFRVQGLGVKVSGGGATVERDGQRGGRLERVEEGERVGVEGF